jgi:peptidoglycan/LPS O-acetylase OafA/YrhL
VADRGQRSLEQSVGNAGPPAASVRPIHPRWASLPPPGESPIDQPDRYPYQPALDGVRALAVSSVLLFHFGVGDVSGGFLGVDLFFVLSGFLITTLLLREHAATGRVRIGAFYGRRARRLLPCLFLVLVAISLFGKLAANQAQLTRLRGDALSSILYVANWRFILSGNSYFEGFSPSPLTHLWSLAIEEQWYLFLPLILIGLLRLIGPPIGRRRWTWIAITAVGVVLSAGLMATLVNDTNLSRAYYGTDTRAQAFLIGTGLALLFHGPSFDSANRRWFDLAGLTGLVGCLAMFWRVGAADTWMYRGGFMLMAACAALLIAGVARSTSGVTSTLLSLSPLPELGRISYGVYLWHWPVFVYLNQERTDLSGSSLLIVRTAVTLLLAIASYELVERPIRQRRWHGWPVIAVPLGGAAVIVALVVAFIPNPIANAALVNPATVDTQRAANGPKVLVAGDSVATTLAQGYRQGVLGRATTVADGSIVGCGLEFPDSECSGVFKAWRRDIKRFDPQTTILLLGRWELLDRVIDNHILRVGSHPMARALSQRLDQGLSILTARGGTVLLFTVQSCFPGGNSAYTPAAAMWFNSLLQSAADRFGPTVRVVDFAGFVCPAGEPSVGIICDGLHFCPSGGEQVWNWLGEQAVAPVPRP